MYGQPVWTISPDLYKGNLCRRIKAHSLVSLSGEFATKLEFLFLKAESVINRLNCGQFQRKMGHRMKIIPSKQIPVKIVFLSKWLAWMKTTNFRKPCIGATELECLGSSLGLMTQRTVSNVTETKSTAFYWCEYINYEENITQVIFSCDASVHLLLR